MVGALLFAGFLVAHAATHIAFVSPPPPARAGGPTWPFSTDATWPVTRIGLTPEAARRLASALVPATCVGFTVAALTAIGIVPVALWTPAIVIGSLASLGLLVAFFHPWLLLGVVIDGALLGATLVAGWLPVSTGLSA